MKKHWIVYRLPYPFTDRAGDIRVGEIYETNGVSFRAAELAAQKYAQNSPGNSFAVLEVSKVYTAEVIEPVIPPVMEKELPDEAELEEDADAELPEFPR